VRDLILNVADQRSITLLLKIGSQSDSIVVVGSQAVDAHVGAVATVIDREFLHKLPLNGRSFQSLLELTPGAVLVSGAGQFSVNGQRDNANYFMIDGVGANTGVTAIPDLGPTAGGTVPAFSVLG